MVVNFGEKETPYSLKIIEILRMMGVMTEFYPDPVKLKKQISYADAKNIPFIIMAGDEEIRRNTMTIKIMSSGEQKKIHMNDLGSFVEMDILK
jgi:histidyl-tRNA synthetase